MVNLKSELEIEVLSAADAACRRPWNDADRQGELCRASSGERNGYTIRDFAIVADGVAAAIPEWLARVRAASSFHPVVGESWRDQAA